MKVDELISLSRVVDVPGLRARPSPDEGNDEWAFGVHLDMPYEPRVITVLDALATIRASLIAGVGCVLAEDEEEVQIRQFSLLTRTAETTGLDLTFKQFWVGSTHLTIEGRTRKRSFRAVLDHSSDTHTKSRRRLFAAAVTLVVGGVIIWPNQVGQLPKPGIQRVCKGLPPGSEVMLEGPGFGITIPCDYELRNVAK